MREFSDLWSLSARIGRGTFWATFVSLFLASLLVRLLLLAISSAGPEVLPLLVLVNLAYLVLAVWLSLAMQVKRWHDLNKSGWMVLINLTIIGLPIALVLLGFVSGTKGPNKYGSDPLQKCRPALRRTRSDATIYDSARFGDLVKVEAMLEESPDLAFSKDNGGTTPLHYAAREATRKSRRFCSPVRQM